jgi:outer membrane protein assembly factor BamB
MMHAIDFRGGLKWRFQAKRAITSSPITNKQALFFSSLDGTLYALDAKNGWAIWRFRLDKGSVSHPHSRRSSFHRCHDGSIMRMCGHQKKFGGFAPITVSIRRPFIRILLAVDQ